MTERDLCTAFFDGHVVKNAAPEPRANRAGSLALGHQAFHDRVSVALDDAKRNAAISQVVRQNFRGKAWLFLIEIHGQQVESDRRALLYVEQEIERRVTVFSTG